MGVMLHLFSFLAVHHTLIKSSQFTKSLLVAGFPEKEVLLYVVFTLTTH
ncbi:MAG: hypothetical protein H6Q26_360 [Bacteroidetes bacterium]|nr:hypothetical protein [Bacteroidota bacterium]